MKLTIESKWMGDGTAYTWSAEDDDGTSYTGLAGDLPEAAAQAVNTVLEGRGWEGNVELRVCPR